MTAQISHDMPIACDLTALEPAVRATHMEAAAQLLGSAAAEVTELPAGYALRYRADQYEQVVQFIANERRCCPFFTFVLEVTPAQGPLWLRITGAEGVKEFIRSELGWCSCS
jgi:hypothetical protein